MRRVKKVTFLIVLFIMLEPMVIAPQSFSRDRGNSFFGTASWYSQGDRGVRRTTANMEVFDDSDFTCAIWNIPFGTRLRVTNSANGKSVVVRVNDRGPARRLVRRGRIIDLTKAAFSSIADTKKGLIRVRVDIESFI